MKLKQLLLELREILDRETNYGYWIGPDNKLIPVEETYGHEAIAGEYMDSQGEHYMEPYTYMFQNGFVRISHENPSYINVEGRKDDLKRVAHILAPTFSQPDITKAVLERLDEEGIGKLAYNTFRLPSESGRAIAFLKGQ